MSDDEATILEDADGERTLNALSEEDRRRGRGAAGGRVDTVYVASTDCSLHAIADDE